MYMLMRRDYMVHRMYTMGNVESLTGSLHTSWMEAFPKEKNSERIFVLTSVTSDANEIPLEIWFHDILLLL